MQREAEIKVFPGSTGKKMTESICRHLDIAPGRAETMTFSDGNTFVRVLETVRDKDIYLIQPIALKPNDELVEIMFWIDAFRRANANSVTVIMPYFGYAKGDKKDEPRVSIRARVCADAIEACGADRLVTMDLHSAQIQGFFRIPVDHLYAMPALAKQIGGLTLRRPVVVSPDVGFAKQARRYAALLKTPVAIGNKARQEHDEKAQIMELIGDVAERDAIIVDDFTVSCGTLADIAQTLKDRGAKRIVACVSHLLLSEAGLARLEQSPIELLLATDTVENPRATQSEKIRIVGVGPMFAETIRRIHYRLSVSELFEKGDWQCPTETSPED